jgi:hypothetical protein
MDYNYVEVMCYVEELWVNMQLFQENILFTNELN